MSLLDIARVSPIIGNLIAKVGGAANIFVTQVGGAYQLELSLQSFAVATDYGLSPTASPSANVIALNNARATGRKVFVPPGVYPVDSPFVTSGPGIVGAGPNRSVLFNTTTNLPHVRVPTGTIGCEIAGLSLDRAKNETTYASYYNGNPLPIANALGGILAVAGGDGIVVEGYTSDVKIRDIYARWNYNGFNLGATNAGTLSGLRSIRNNYNGVFMTTSGWQNPGGSGLTEVQWKFTGETSLMTLNANDGVAVTTVGSTTPGITQITLSDWAGLETYMNGRHGVSAIGTTAIKIPGVRMRGGLLGNDQVSALYLDTYHGLHVINGVFFEEGAGYGLRATANNTDLVVQNSKFSNIKSNGIYSESPKTSIVGGAFRTNGTNVGLSDAARASVLLTGVDSTIANIDSIGSTYAIVLTGARNAIIGGSSRAGSVGAISQVGDTKRKSFVAWDGANSLVSTPDT